MLGIGVLRTDLNQISQFEPYDKGDPNEVRNDWKTKLSLIAELNAPHITGKLSKCVCQYAFWITDTIRKLYITEFPFKEKL